MEKKSISVPEMQRMLGLKKVAAYWLVKQGRFETIMVGGKMRVMVNSFEAWYRGQFHYRKVNGPPPGEDWSHTWSVPETAEMLGVTPTTIYELIQNHHPFQTVQADGQIRIVKTSFEEWYQGQSRYRKREDAAPPELWQSTWSVREVANLLGVHRNVVYGMVNDRHLFPSVLVDGHIRIDKEDFEDWYCSQNHYKKIEKEV